MKCLLQRCFALSDEMKARCPVQDSSSASQPHTLVKACTQNLANALSHSGPVQNGSRPKPLI